MPEIIKKIYKIGHAHPVKYPVMCNIISAMPVAPVVPTPAVCGVIFIRTP
jgi:hypothetical protein